MDLRHEEVVNGIRPVCETIQIFLAASQMSRLFFQDYEIGLQVRIFIGQSCGSYPFGSIFLVTTAANMARPHCPAATADLLVLKAHFTHYPIIQESWRPRPDLLSDAGLLLANNCAQKRRRCESLALSGAFWFLLHHIVHTKCMIITRILT